MKKKRLEVLRTKLAMLALATSLSGCATLSTEQIEKSINENKNFEENAGLYQKQDGIWDIYFKKNGKYYDFHSHEYLEEVYYDTRAYEDDKGFFYWDSGYLPFAMCNANVTYTLNVVNHLSTEDIEKLKNDFFENNRLLSHDIKLFHIEKIDGTDKQIIIGYPASDTEIFNIETLQMENYEGYAIVQEDCKFQEQLIYLSEILEYFHQEKKIEESTVETETSQDKNFDIVLDANSCTISIAKDATTEELQEVQKFFALNDDLQYVYLTCYSENKKETNEILKVISTNDHLIALELWHFENLNLSDILTMSQLKELGLIRCSLEDVQQLNQFTQLEQLTLCNIIHDLNVISNLTQLKKLLVINPNSMKINDIEILRQFKNLEILELPQNNISDISSLADLNQLTFLDLRSNKIHDIKSLEFLKNLEYVSLKGNPITDISVLKDMKSAPMIFLGDEVNIDNLKPYISELTEKGFHIYIDNELITEKNFVQDDELELKLNNKQ